MTDKMLVETFVSCPWWLAERDELLDKDFTLEFPFAPPGMVQYPCRGQISAHKIWMGNTVSNWTVSIERIYNPKDAASGVYFAVYTVCADTRWGGVTLPYRNRHIDRVTVKNGKIINLREWSNPLEWLKAAGREIPIFRVEIPWQDVPKYRNMRVARERDTTVYDLSPEAIKERMAQNIRAFCASTSAENHKTYDSPNNYDRTVYWLPPEMKEHVEGDEVDQMEAWTWDSMHSWQLMDDAVAYETDDPKCVFFETGGYGQVSWLGNNSTGGYHNWYLKYMEMDEHGFIIKYGEYVNPINKFNSINKSIPSFPWLY